MSGIYVAFDGNPIGIFALVKLTDAASAMVLECAVSAVTNSSGTLLLTPRWMKRPPKTPDRVYPVVKNQEYDRAYDWEHRSG